MRTIKCSVSYHETKFQFLETFADGVHDGQFNNTGVFNTPPVSKITFEKHIANYANSYSAYKKGGANQKGQFLIDKGVLMGDLDLFAVSTDKIANGSEAITILGGFLPTKGSDSSSTVPDAPVTTLTRGESTGMIIGEASVVPGATGYGAFICSKMLSTLTYIDKSGQLTIGPSDFIMKLDLTKSRKKTFINLTAGTLYYVYFYATNTAGVSQLSKMESIMCV